MQGFFRDGEARNEKPPPAQACAGGGPQPNVRRVRPAHRGARTGWNGLAGGRVPGALRASGGVPSSSRRGVGEVPPGGVGGVPPGSGKRMSPIPSRGGGTNGPGVAPAGGSGKGGT